MKKPKIHNWEATSTLSIDLPDWVHPQSTASEWLVPRTGFKLDPTQTPTSSKYAKVNFNYKFCDNSQATDAIWNLLSLDLKSSAIALIESSTSKRPNSLTDFIRTAFEIVDHVLESKLRSSPTPRIITLTDISTHHIKSFLEAHDLAFMGINITAVNSELGSTTRNRQNITSKIATMDIPSITKKILIQKLKNTNATTYGREFKSACNLDETEHSLSISTIQNKCTNLSYLHTIKEHQAYKFEIGKHEITEVLNSVSEGFLEKNQTPLMPTNIAFHYISHAIKFHRDYAPLLRKYIQDLDNHYTSNIHSTYAESTIKSNVHTFRRQTFDAVPMPVELKSLNIKTFGKSSSGRGPLECYAELRDHISTNELIGFYAITTRILIHTFTACRLLSAALLDKDCLTLSKMDGLWDIKLKTPKTSNSNELEIIKRPIPKVIWDFIYEYISFMENRHRGMTSIWPSDARKDTDRNEQTNRKLLDQYSDWIEVPLIDQNRWYARPHQFRRFFAAFFFYLGEGTNIEPLRWMMGHIEPSVTLYYADISTQPDWERETLEFLTEFLEGHVGKDVLVDYDLVEDLSDCSLQVKLGDHALLAEHLRELSSHRHIKLKILNDQKIYIYASK
jgi:hypothetical protein